MDIGNQDPREIITPDAFSVASELLGTPLARPWRRGVAMAVDLLAVVILGAAGWFFLGVALALLAFRAAFRRTPGMLGRGARIVVFGSLGLLITLVTLGATSWDLLFKADKSATIDAGGVVTTLGLGEAGATVVDVLAVNQAETEQELHEAATRLADRLRRQGAEPNDIREALEGLTSGSESPWVDRVIGTIVDTMSVAATATDPDSTLQAYLAARSGGDSARMASLRNALAEALAADRLASQARRIDRLESQNRRLEQQLEEAEERGLIRTLFRLADEVGIGFGWAGLYFTLSLAFWRGRTPGKRLLGIRVVRLDGKPIGLWASFNRFGGYAASIFTGLLGFFEMFWDRNRQALHDRIAATVVIHERGRASAAGRTAKP